MSDQAQELKVKAIEETIGYWINQPFISDNLRESLVDKNLLLTPHDGHVDANVLCFPNGTEELLQFLRENQEGGLNVDICIEDEDFRELALYSDIQIMPDVITTLFLAPLAVSLISSWITANWGSRKNETKIRHELKIVIDENNSKTISTLYEGSAEYYAETMQQTVSVIKSLSNDGDEDIPKRFSERLARLSTKQNDETLPPEQDDKGKF